MKWTLGAVLSIALVLVNSVAGIADKEPTLLRASSEHAGFKSNSYDSGDVQFASSGSTGNKNPSVFGFGASGQNSYQSGGSQGKQLNSNTWGSGFEGTSYSAQASSTAGGGSSVSYQPAGNNQYQSTEAGPANPSYAYYYQHYPNGQGGGSWSGDEQASGSGLFGGLTSGFGDLGGGGGFGGLGAAGGIGILGILAKGILAVKPFLILGLLLLIALPVLLFFLPIPIITVTGQTPNPGLTARSGPTTPGTLSMMGSYLTELSSKVLNAEECLERIICKIPQMPERYQNRAKLMWDEYGTAMVKSHRVQRGLGAYFEAGSKNRNFKCNQRFKCSNKFI